MFDQLVAATDGTRGAGAVGAWARVENAACARRLRAIADVLEARLAADGSAEREQWCIDNWDAVAAEVAAAQSVSLGVAAHQLMIATALRERLPRVAEVFAARQISYRLVNAIVARTRLIKDPAAMAKVDAELAAEVVGWGALSVAKTRPPSTTGWIATTRMPWCAPSSVRAAATSTWWPVLTGPGCRGSRARCSARMPPRWISGWMRWRAECAGEIRARSSSAAPMRWARWPMAGIGWPASAGARTVPLRLPPPARWSSTWSPRRRAFLMTLWCSWTEPVRPGAPPRSCGR